MPFLKGKVGGNSEGIVKGIAFMMIFLVKVVQVRIFCLKALKTEDIRICLQVGKKDKIVLCPKISGNFLIRGVSDVEAENIRPENADKVGV